MLIASDRRHVQHWRRDGAEWRVADLVGTAVLSIAGLGNDLPLVAINDGFVD